MTKKELKDIILKTLEKEGGAAGLKALAKAAKTPKNKLKKDLDDMSGVKQHQDGDYISTPIDEVQMLTKCKKDSDCRGTAICVDGFCLEDPNPDLFPDGGTPSKKPISRKPIPRKPMRRKPMSRKPMRLREIKEIIKDYISTPINERETAQAGMFSSGGSCICSCPEGYGTPTLGNSTFQYGGGGYSASDCEAACNSVPCYELEGGTTTTSTPGSDKDNIFVEPVKRPSKPVKKPTFRRPERSKKPMRLREAEEAIIEMINEKLCKKGKAYIAKRKRAGEKSSAYLSGRAVKVCKGQMKG